MTAPGAAAGEPDAEPVLALRGVSKRFGGVVANDDISFKVGRGALVGLIGPNGSGKTTLFNCITGQNPPDAGEVLFDGRRIDGLAPAPIARLGVMRSFQQAGVYDGMTSLQNMQVSASHAGESLHDLWRRPSAPVRERALQWLNFVGLATKRDALAGELSYGQRKLLEFAMALMNEPKILLLDEPTAGVSPALVPELIEQLRRANTELGITLLLIEHNLQVVMALAQEVHCLAQGRLLASGTPEAIRADARVVDAYLGTA
jgi:ABC-type branched-subunit amino acid transport system ATPase component